MYTIFEINPRGASPRWAVVKDASVFEYPVTVAEVSSEEAAKAAKRLLSGAVQVSTETTK